MIVEFVTFRALPGADWDAILADAPATIPRWRANSATCAQARPAEPDGKECAGLYVWPTRQAATRCGVARGRAAYRLAPGAPLFRTANAARQRGRDGYRGGRKLAERRGERGREGWWTYESRT